MSDFSKRTIVRKVLGEGPQNTGGPRARIARPLLAAAMAPIIAFAITTSPARADAIDGHWCSKSGEHLSINGADIVTPGGTRMTGNYDRHGFAYTVPASEKGAGTAIEMSQMSEQRMLLRRKPPGASDFGGPETWSRCSATS